MLLTVFPMFVDLFKSQYSTEKNNRSVKSRLSLALIHSSTNMLKSVWMSGLWKPLVHTTMSRFLSTIFLPHFAWQDHFPLIFYFKLLSISDLIVADLDTQSILSMVYKYPKILWTSGFVCGRVDFRSYSSTLQVPRNP